MKEENYEYNPVARLLKELKEYHTNALTGAQVALNQGNSFKHGFNEGCAYAYERVRVDIEILMRYYDITPKHIEE